MKTVALAFATILLSLPAAQAADRSRAEPRVARPAAHANHAAERRRSHLATRPAAPRRYVYRDDAEADDLPYGPIYQTQEQELQSRYDVSAGRRGNIKEYWWRY